MDVGTYEAGESLYAQPEEDDSDSSPQPAAPPSSSSSPSQALVQTAQLIADPSSLAQQAVNPSTTVLPFGWAVLGACAVAVLWAAKLDGGGKR
jgi:hypothetical protein